MMQNSQNKRIRMARVIALAGTALCAGMAYAQTTPLPKKVPEANDIVVTGTRIRGIAPVGSPVIGISADQIKASGLGNINEVLRDVPQISSLGADEGSVAANANNASSNTTKSTGINLRGLGTQATLVLINGERYAPGGNASNFYDPTVIPTIAMSSVEVVPDGSSSTYGSDAIAGVVNLILKKDYEGAKVSARYGAANQYDSERFSGIIGHKWSGGGFMIAGEWSRHSNLLMSNRPQYFTGAADARPAVQTSPFPALPFGYTSTSSTATVTSGGTSYATPFNTNVSSPLGASLVAGTRNTQSVWAGGTALPEQRRTSIVTSFHQELTPGLEFYAQGFYSQRNFEKSYGRSTGPATNQSFNGGNAITTNNPFFITGLAGGNASQTLGSLSLLDAIGPLNFSGYEQNWQGLIGVHIKIPGGWRADLNASLNQSQDYRYSGGLINACTFTGTPSLFSGTCAAGGLVNGVGLTAATAFNPYGASNPAVVAAIRAFNVQHYTNRFAQYNARFDGPLFSLPGGKVLASFGASLINQRASYNNFRNDDTANTGTIRYDRIGGKSHIVKAAYGEIVIPIFGENNAIPGFQKLSLSLADRIEDDTAVATSTANTPKIGLTWSPIKSLKISSSWGKSFHADLNSSDANLVAIAANTSYTYGAGTFNGGNLPGNQNVLTLKLNGATIQPETSTNFSLGFEYKPEFARGVQLTATYYAVDYKNIIDGPGGTIDGGLSSGNAAFYAPYIQERPDLPNTNCGAAADAAFEARVTGLYASTNYQGVQPAVCSISGIVDERNVNAGSLKTKGIDFTASYGWSNSLGHWSLGMVGNYILQYKRSLTPTSPLTDVLNTLDFPTTYRLRGMFSWSKNGWEFNGFVNYTPSYANTQLLPSVAIGSYTTFDASLGYNTGEGKSEHGALANISISLNAQNLFNASAPYALTNSNRQTIDTQQASAIGRTVSLEISKKF